MSDKGRRTLPWDLLRGTLEGAGHSCYGTFALLVAIKYFDCSDNLKSLIASGPFAPMRPTKAAPLSPTSTIRKTSNTGGSHPQQMFTQSLRVALPGRLAFAIPITNHFSHDQFFPLRAS